MTLVQGELVDDQSTHFVPVYRRELAYQPCLVDPLDGVPRQGHELGDVLDGQQLAKLLDVPDQPSGHLAGAVQPVNGFAPHAAIRTAYPANGELHAESAVQQVAIANPASHGIVNLETSLGASAAEGDAVRAKLQKQVALFDPVEASYAVAFPKQGAKFSFHLVKWLWSVSSSL